MFIARELIVGIYCCFTIVFLNFGINILPDYQMTIAVAYPVVFLMLCRLNVKMYRLTLYFSCALLFPVIIGIVGFISDNKLNYLEFIRTYLLYFHFCFSLLIINSMKINPRIMDALDRAIKASLVIVGILTIMQFAGFFIAGVPLFFNPFGKYSIGGIYDPYRFISIHGTVRPSAFYWEPSTNAVVILMLTNYLVVRNINKFKKYYSMQLALLLLINSMTGLLASGITFLLWINSVFKKDLYLKISVTAFFLLGLVALSMDRIRELFIAGTSGHFRWRVPVDYFLDYIQAFPLGLPLGQLAYPLDNGILVAIIYTGVFGLLVGLVFLLHFLRLSMLNRITVETQLSVASILLMMIFNGAFLTPEMSFLMCLVIVAWKSGRLIKPVKN